MQYVFKIPKGNKIFEEVTLKKGESLFILGANGSGKSSLMHYLYSAHASSSRRIAAHRQTWFSSNAVTLSPEQKRNTENNIKSNDTNPQSRWKDDYSSHRASIAIYDLIDAENVRARSIAGAVDKSDLDLAKLLSKKDAPIKVINELLRLSNLPIEISVKENEQVVASRMGSAHYSIAELSDGERNAVLIAANVLTVKDGTLVLIDEPERHLHRSIISPLLTQLFNRRPDCAFVVSTHDITLPLDNSSALTLLVRDCVYVNSSVTHWDVDLVKPLNEADDEELKKDILGARKRLLFVEGTDSSLDRSIYSLIFPKASVIAKSSCRDVEHSVSGVRDSHSLHWLKAFGIIDNDRRTPEEIARLTPKGIYPISVYSVESIYYHPTIQSKVSLRYSSITGDDHNQRLDSAKSAAIAAIRPHTERLSNRVVERKIRGIFFQNIPNKQNISSRTPINFSIDVGTVANEEVTRLQNALDHDDLPSIISRYPVRETPALAEIATKLGFQSREQYESSVRKLLMDDSEALSFVRTLFGSLFTDLMET